MQMLQYDWPSDRTLLAISFSVVACRLRNIDGVFLFFQSFGGVFSINWIIKFLTELKEEHLRCFNYKNLGIVE